MDRDARARPLPSRTCGMRAISTLAAQRELRPPDAPRVLKRPLGRAAISFPIIRTRLRQRFEIVSDKPVILRQILIGADIQQLVTQPLGQVAPRVAHDARAE